MSSTYDVAIAGLGAFGAAAAAVLAERGVSTIGFDRFRPPHLHGSSHGGSRMIREAYFEAPFYVPLVQRAYERWAEIEARVGRPLLEQTGGLMVGPPGGSLVSGCLASARAHQLPYEELTAAEIADRFPFTPQQGTVGVLEPRAGMLDPEASIAALLDLAAASGAELHFEEPLASWRWDDGLEGSGGRLELATAGGGYRARRLLVAAGAWTASLLPDLGLPLEVERVIQFWLRPADGEPGDPAAPTATCPVWAWECEPGAIWYGFPDRGRGVKMGFHQSGEIVDPDGVRREVSEGEAERMRRTAERYMPAAAGPVREAAVCMYTNTPDEHFLIDRHPGRPEVWFAGGGSGHGFKFASALGEALADLLTDRDPGFDVDPFRLARFG